MVSKQVRTRRGISIWAVVGLLLLVAAVTTIALGFGRTQSPPQPEARSDSPTETTSQTSPPANAEPTATASSTAGMDASTPTRLSIPAIDVDTRIMELGLTKNDELEVPPLGKNAPAGWYRRSPTPGEVGPSLIVGHVDSAADGPAVFFDLGGLQHGDTLVVTREDGSTAKFSIDDVTDYGKDAFPDFKVYGNTSEPEIRLITCGGDFNEQTGHYEDNIVVTGHLVRHS
ncbi:MAG: class F sortase [Brevibacterium sp.]|nr:class F sortase [Brevibacterium sp.]